MQRSSSLVIAAEHLRHAVARLSFGRSVAVVYNPLEYAWPIHAAYALRYGSPPKRVVFVGMNPGPFGMTQTGVPFGEIAAVRDWLKLEGRVGKPKHEHPKRPVLGFACRRSEVSGHRLWGLFARRFGTPEAFFAQHFVANYCPLVFMSETGANITPDKLPAAEAHALYQACDEHLREVVRTLRPEWIVSVGGFAAERAIDALHELPVRITRILHPSPACPAANRDWAGQVTRTLVSAGVW
jgi:single-strand selective monofunctional uracil DNA glycosylase